MAMASATVPQESFGGDAGILDAPTDTDREWWAAESARLESAAEMRAYYDGVPDERWDEAYGGSGLAFPDGPEGGAR